jgi:hypothetical protein
MKIVEVVVLTVEEARSELARFFADFLTDDRDNLLEMISQGRLNKTVPNLPELTDSELARNYAEFEFLGDRYLNANPNVAKVLIPIAEYEWYCVADRKDQPAKTTREESTQGEGEAKPVRSFWVEFQCVGRIRVTATDKDAAEEDVKTMPDSELLGHIDNVAILGVGDEE